MKIKKIFIGSWYSRTQLHLSELHLFFTEGRSHLSLNKEKLLKYKKNINPSNASIIKENGHEILVAKLDKYDLEYHENGLVLMSIDPIPEKINQEMKSLADFTLNKMFDAFGFLFSQGAPIPKIFIALKSILPYVVLAEGSTKQEIERFFVEQKEEIRQEIKNDESIIYYGNRLIVINGKAEDNIDLVRIFYLLNDAKNQFQKVLDLHRFIWEEVDKVKSKGKIRYCDLSLNRDTLMEINNEIIFFKSRLEQVNNVLANESVECAKMNKLKPDDKIAIHFMESFESLKRTSSYIKNLWSMTENYVSNTFNLINLLYQEGTQKQLNILQFIFVISAIASIITMGSVYGFEINLFDKSGLSVLHGESISFAFFDLLRFGGTAILAGSALYLLFTLIYNKVAASRITDPRLIENKEFGKIKKMLGE
ncbi:MAG: hypothetical protein COX31_02855 [Candidatus Moranbacteria bacterium CG23_combo_of_CG06-09_8_20_14_all_40_16]|nr:MAG: hypothetical protein COX31_02855 [Candidatus Moranbacteria bacterium CG23_combo_of_CG06-09_8_20_14_all_40_16]